MCDPITLGAMALSAGGSLVNSSEQNATQGRMIAARNRATQEELARQRAFQAQSGKTFNKQMVAFDPHKQESDLQAAQGAATDQFKANAPIDVGGISSGNGPQVVNSAADKSVADAFGRGTAQDAALGQLTGWNQRALNNNLGLNNTGRNLDLTSDFAKTSAAVNRLEQDADYRNAYQPNSGIGDIMKFAGSVGAYEGGQGKTLGGMFKPFFSSSFDPTNMAPSYWGGGVPGVTSGF